MKSKITNVRLDKRRVYFTTEYGGTIDLPRREGGHLLHSIGSYDNGKWTAIDTYRELIGQTLAEHGREVWIEREAPKRKEQQVISPAPVKEEISDAHQIQEITLDDKVQIISDEILPSGEGEERGQLTGLSQEQKPEVDTSKYKEVMGELGIRAVKIYRRRESIGILGDNKYEVFETPSGKFIALSPEPKNAVYVAQTLEVLLRDKQTLIKDKAAQRIWRQGAWRNRVRELA